MKKCTYCGRENPDDATHCKECVTAFEVSSEVAQPEMTVESKRFWERMTFRDFAILLVRLQALWLLFYVVIDLTYLQSYISRFIPVPRYDVLPIELQQTFHMAILRMTLRIVVAILAFKFADRLIDWLGKGFIQNPPPNKSQEPTAVGASSSASRSTP